MKYSSILQVVFGATIAVIVLELIAFASVREALFWEILMVLSLIILVYEQELKAAFKREQEMIA